MGRDARQLLFSYARLQHPELQLDTFGRRVATTTDVLAGYRLGYAETADAGVAARSGGAPHRVVRRTGDPRDKVVGAVLEVTADELDAADELELARFRRVSAVLESGRRAWVYVDEAPAAGAD